MTTDDETRALTSEDISRLRTNEIEGWVGGIGARVASAFKVRCMRSCRPFCCGLPGSIDLSDRAVFDDRRIPVF